MEQDQELRMLDKSNMPDDFNESSHNEPETWYKIVRSVAAEEGVDLSSHSGDELDLSHDESISDAKPPSAPPKTPHSTSKPTKQLETSTHHTQDKDYRSLQQAYADTRQELKTTSRENRDQSLELRDLKRRLAVQHEQTAQLREQNSLLHEAYQASQDARGGEKLTKSERVKYSEHFEMLESHIAHLQRERHKRETHMEFLTEQTREANDGKERLEGEMRKMQRQMRDLSANLTECKDDLLRLQPTSQVSDTEISELFSNVDQQIAGWVDDKTEDAAVLEDKIRGIKTVDGLPELLRKFATSDHLRLAKKYPDSQPLLLRFYIHRYLQTFILSGEVYLFGLDARNIALFQGMEEGMKQLEPRRDEKTLRNWRSETLRGLLQMPTFIEEQNRQARLATDALSAALNALVSPSADSPRPTHENNDSEDLHTQIILPSIQLANKLRLSTVDYRLLFRPFARDPGKASTAYHYEIPNASMVDLQTHKVIRPDSVLKVGDDGRIGEDVLVVSPALVRDSKDGGRGKVLVCKPTVVVKLDEPMGKRSRGIRALGAWTPSWFFGDDGLE